MAKDNPNFDTTRRKFHTQMTAQEVYAVKGAILNHKNWTLSPHAKDEMFNDHVDMIDVFKVIQYGKIMEVNNCAITDVTVVVRHTIGQRSIAVVVSLVRGCIVTIYANSVQSGQRKPNMADYKWQAPLTVFNRVSVDNLRII